MPGPRSLPPALADRARHFVAGNRTPAAATPASTVVLIRDAAAGPQVYLLRRHAGMTFAAGMHVFPGGAVDPRDSADDDLPWRGPSLADWAARLGGSQSMAQGYVCAAVRELFEEAGVLLASAGDRERPPARQTWEGDRQALVQRRLALSELLRRRGLALHSDLLAPWAHWITPRFEPRRYDTWFFLAALPPGQQAHDVSGEANRAEWVGPADVLRAASTGEVTILPPTWAVLEELAEYRSVADTWAACAGRRIEAVTPGWVEEHGDVRVLLPGDAAFPGDDPGEPA